MSKYYLLDLERTIQTGAAHYWRSHNTGYTADIALAGLYQAAKAFEIARDDDTTVPIDQHTVERILSHGLVKFKTI